MEKMKKLILFLFLAFFMFNFVSAVPPVQSNTIVDKGITIEAPAREFVQAGEDYNFYIHVYNSTDGLLIHQSDISYCTIHVYDGDGSHITETNMSADGNGIDWEYEMLGGNFTETGSYAVLYYCEVENDIGGFLEYSFYVTPSGKELTLPITHSYIGLLALLVFLFLVNMGAIAFLDDKRFKSDEEGNLIDSGSIVYLKPVLYVVGWLLLLGTMFISSNFALAYLNFEMFGNILFKAFLVMGYMTIPLIILWVIWILTRIFGDKEYKSMMERGLKMGDI